MARLSMAERRQLGPEDYVFPEKAPGHGSYPIPVAESERGKHLLEVAPPVAT